MSKMGTSTEPMGCRSGRRRGQSVLGAVAVSAALVLGLASAASASTEVQKVAPISAPTAPHVIEIDAGLTPEQQQLAHQLSKESGPTGGEIGTRKGLAFG